ncbi:MAG: DNA-binding response regulator [bacterium]|jgi:DNA-binding response OmpR family regulator|nr:DNA-binding response regulator [Candidatus Aquidulcis sp.]
MKILLIEDERALREALAEALAGEGFVVVQAETGAAGLAAFRAAPPDLILLDLMLPEMGGIEVCRSIRMESRVPIIMVTAKASEADRISGLDLGADDYVTKPFSSRELIARIRAVMRRAELGANTPALGARLRIAEAEVDLEGQRVLRNGVAVHLKPKAFQLLAFLIENAGRVYTREQLLDKVWGYDYAGETRTVDVHMHALRQAMEAIPAKPVALQTVRGIGYVLRRPA